MLIKRDGTICFGLAVVVPNRPTMSNNAQHYQQKQQKQCHQPKPEQYEAPKNEHKAENSVPSYQPEKETGY
ncbi:uncharacterized protein PG986_008524 [Apiospora aurea]|uniref:Uncharacterized protein n=1 Tax=Apiospora aurea TaxID=335848 RepID=A0ABR1QFN7_9PEZI